MKRLGSACSSSSSGLVGWSVTFIRIGQGSMADRSTCGPNMASGY